MASSEEANREMDMKNDYLIKLLESILAYPKIAEKI